MKIRLGFLGGIRVGSIGIPPSGAPVTYSISGTVYDADGTTAVEGATVAIGASNTTSAANGTYTISGLAAGTNGSLTCTKSGYSWRTIAVSAMSGNLDAQNYRNEWWAAGGISASCVAAYQPLNAASLAASYINLKNPGTNNAATGTAPSFAASTGWSFLGSSSQYLTTGITSASGYSLVCRFANVSNGADNQYLIGSRNTTGNRRLFLLLHTGVTNQVAYGSGGAVTVTPELLTGVVAVTNQQGYRNGTAEGAGITAWDSPSNGVAITIGALNANGTPGNYLTGDILLVAIYNGSIASQVTMLTTAMNSPMNPPDP